MSIKLCKKCKRNIETKNCNVCIIALAKRGTVWVAHNSYLTGHAAKQYQGKLFDVEAYQRLQQEPQSGSWKYANNMIPIYKLESDELLQSTKTGLLGNYDNGEITSEQAGDILTNAVNECHRKQIIKERVGTNNKPSVNTIEMVEQADSTELLLNSIESDNNGGKTDYYQLSSAPFPINDFDDFAEWRELNGFQFNMGKVMWTFNVGRHDGTNQIRDLNKVIHYAEREKARILKQLSKDQS